MAGQCCDNCVYSICDPELVRRWLWMREPIVPRCANHPMWPSQLHDVPGVPCRNYRPKPVLPQGDAVRMIPLGDGFYAYVDAADYDELSRYTWHLNNGYASRREKGRRIYMHTDIMHPPKGKVVDHFDGNKTNNCRLNLRVCTQAENLRNQRKRHGARSRFKGVIYCEEHRKWCARCRFEGRTYTLGYYDDEAEAARAYDRKAAELFGEFARLNFPEEWPPQRRAQVYAQRDAAKTEGKKVGRKEGKRATARREKAVGSSKKAEGRTPAAKPPAIRTKDGPKATRRKTKGRRREDSAKIINRKSSIINPKGTPGRRVRRCTTKAKDGAKATRRKT
jgi:hypothetical protein